MRGKLEWALWYRFRLGGSPCSSQAVFKQWMDTVHDHDKREFMLKVLIEVHQTFKTVAS